MTWPLFAGEPHGQRVSPGAPNILLLVFDTFSAPHMSLLGYRRETTPHISAFAERALVYHNHHAAGNFTTPGTAAILTGTYSWTNRAFHLHGLVDRSFEEQNIFAQMAALGYYQAAYSHNLLVMSLLHQFRRHLDAFIPTRALCLADNQVSDRLFYPDYTPAFLAESQYLNSRQLRGSLILSWLQRLVHFADKRTIERDLGGRFPRGIPELHRLMFVLEDAIDWVALQAGGLPDPYFSYVHLLPPHEPYATRREFVNRFADNWTRDTKARHFLAGGTPGSVLLRQRRFYDEYIAYVDAEFGRLVAALERSGALDNTIILLTSDHGQSFERGLHGHISPLLYEPLTHIPLLIRLPGQAARQDIYSLTSSVDLLPSLLHLIGGKIPPWTEGEVLPGLSSAEPDPLRKIFSVEAKGNSKNAPLQKSTVAMHSGSHKMIRYDGFPNMERPYELYDLEADPEELVDLYNTRTELAAEMRAVLDQKIQQVNKPFLGS
jgi:arylsulfatase A-like enzyme